MSYLPNKKIFFKITKKDFQPGTGRKKEVSILVTLYEHISKSENSYNPVLTISAESLLTILYNTIIFQAIPNLVVKKNFINLSDYANLYKLLSQRLQSTVPPLKQTDDQFIIWCKNHALKPVRETYRDYLTYVYQNNQKIYVTTTYHLSPSYSLTFDQNMNEMMYIFHLCLLTISGNENIPSSLLYEFNRKKNSYGHSRFDYSPSIYMNDFSSRPSETIDILYKDNNGTLNDLKATDHLADLVYYCTSYLNQYSNIIFGICQNCGKAFIPKTKHPTLFCSDRCRQAFHDYESATMSGKIYKHIEDTIKANIYEYCKKGGPNYNAGKKALKEWQTTARIKKENIDDFLNNYTSPDDTTLVQITAAIFERDLISEFKIVAKKYGFRPKTIPKPVHTSE